MSILFSYINLRKSGLGKYESHPYILVLFWVGAWFSMEGFRILKIAPPRD